MSHQNDGNPTNSSDNHDDLGTAVTVTQPFVLEDWVRDDPREESAAPEVGQRECTNDLIQQHNDGGQNSRQDIATDTEAEVISVPAHAAAASAAAAAPKARRKNVTRAKKHLLAGKDVFLLGAYQQEFAGADDLVLQGFIAECPNKSSNQGRFRIDWEKNTSLPPTAMPAMLQQWHPSDKDFRERLDKAIEKWNNEATEEQKKRVGGKKRKQSSTVTDSGVGMSNVMETPPATHLVVVARAGLRTGTSTLSSLSSRSATTILERRTVAPSVTDDAAPSDDDCSVGTSSARSSMHVESDSDDGSDLDKEDNACENLSDGDEDEEEFRSHAETEDLSARARGPLGDCLKALQWKFEVVSQDNPPVLQQHRPHAGPHGLRVGVSKRFTDPFACFAERGGMTVQFIARLAANSNDCFWQHTKPKLGRDTHNGLSWMDITIKEMHHFLGIMLKTSLSTADGGGCTACFNKEDRVICSDAGRQPKTIRIANSKGWAQDVMALSRFKQMMLD